MERWKVAPRRGRRRKLQMENDENTWKIRGDVKKKGKKRREDGCAYRSDSARQGGSDRACVVSECIGQCSRYVCVFVCV